MLNPLSAIAHAFMRAYDYKGRSTRAEFWWFALFTFLVLGAICLAYKFMGLDLQIGMILSLFVIVPFIMVLIRRLHDRNRSAYIIVAPFIIILVMAFIGVGFSLFTNYLLYLTYIFYVLCVLSFICIMISCLKEGTKGDNDYGPDPLDE